MSRPKLFFYPKIKSLSKRRFNEFTETLFRTRVIELDGIGVFELRDIPTKTIRHNITGKRLKIKARKSIVFLPTGKLKELCKR
jgi:nucleoid DNA-binding protein